MPKPFSIASGNFHPRINFVILSALLFAYPLSIRLSSFFTIALILHWIVWLRFKIGDKFMENRGSILPPMILFGLYVISLAYSSNLSYGLFSVEKRLSFLVFPLVLGTIPVSIPGKKLFWVSFCSAILAILLTLILAFQRFPELGERAFYWGDLTDTIGFHPSYFTLFISFIIFWSFHLYHDQWSEFAKWKKTGIVVVLLFLVCYLILLASKIQLFLFFIISLIHVIVIWKRLSLWIKIGLPLTFIVLGIVGYTTILKDRISHISTLTYRLDDPVEKFNEATIRLALVECSAEVIKNNFFFGVGVGDSYDELDKVYRKHDYKFGYLDQQDPHNEYLSTMICVGVLGIVTLLFMWIRPFYLAMRYRNFPYAIFLSLFIIGAFFESLLSQQKGVVLFGIFNSIFGVANMLNRRGS